MSKRNFWKNYWFIIAMLVAIVSGSITGAVWPGATIFEPLGSVFINLMLCVVVPMVFVSISGAIANMKSRRRAGKILGTTIGTFFVTGGIAAVLMYILMRIVPIVTASYDLVEGEVDKVISIPDMLVNFFTVPDFVDLLSRKAMLPLIVAAVLFGFAVQACGGPDSMVGKFLSNLSDCIMALVKIITYYAPIGFFGFFAYLTATYGPKLIGDYSRTLIVYYVFCFVYMFIAFPIYAKFGGGKGGAKIMFKHLFRPAVTSFGTCSSVATIPTNIAVAEETGISKDVTDIVLPLGATMHMDGSSMSAILKVAFLFGIFGKDFTGGTAIIAILVAVFSSVAMSGIPGGGGIGELVLCTLFFPDQLSVAFPIALALGNLIDPPATMVNSAGDYVASFIVSRYVDGKDWLQKAQVKLGKSKNKTN